MLVANSSGGHYLSKTITMSINCWNMQKTIEVRTKIGRAMMALIDTIST